MKVGWGGGWDFREEAIFDFACGDRELDLLMADIENWKGKGEGEETMI